MRKRSSQRRFAIVTAALAVGAPGPAPAQEAPRPTPSVAELVRRGRSFVGPVERLDAVRTVDALATCEGPSGEFTTRVRSHRDGDLVFHQSYEYREGDFLAGVRGGRAWQRDASSAITEAGNDVLSVLRSHEFVMIPLNPGSRLSDPHPLEDGTFAGVRVSTVGFVDEVGNRVEIHYALDDGRPVGLTFQNPLGRGARTIDVEYTGWSRVDGLRLPSRLTITHGEGVWRYRFTRIEVDTLTREDFDPRRIG